MSPEKNRRKNFPEKPLAANAAITELGPGILKIFIFSFNASFTKTEPGSEMHGVPASDIREIILSDLSKFIIPLRFFFR